MWIWMLSLVLLIGNAFPVVTLAEGIDYRPPFPWQGSDEGSSEGEEPEEAQGEQTDICAVSAYVKNDKLYAFVDVNEDMDVNDAGLKLFSADMDSTAEVPLVHGEGNVHYIFMIDASKSMRTYKDTINAYLEGITEGEQRTAYYTLATFGDMFDVVKEKMTDGNALLREMDHLSFSERYTDPYGGMKSALRWLDGYPRAGGDLVCLVMITDGKPEYETLTQEEVQELMGEAKDAIENTPEVVISSFCVGQWKQEAGEILQAGRGMHEAATKKEQAETAGKELASWLDKLYLAEYIILNKMPSRFDIQLLPQDVKDNAGNKILYETCLELTNVPNLDLGIAGEWQEITPTETEKPTETAEPAETAEPTETVKETEISENDKKEEEQKDEEQKDDERDDDEEEESSSILVPVAIGACAVIVICAVGMIILSNKNREKSMKAQPAPGSIPLQLEVYAGRCLVRSTTLYLADSLLIGSAQAADIRFDEPSVAPQHAKLVQKNGQVYITDLGTSSSGVAVEGMRIQGENILRSNNVITIGDAEFGIKF